MERSTTDVVGGALLAENAGAALLEIDQVSNQIASLVQNISASARGQAAASQALARNMQVLREISTQSADSTSATSQSIIKLADLAAALRKSIAGFRLPGGTDTSGMHRTLSQSASRELPGTAASGGTQASQAGSSSATLVLGSAAAAAAAHSGTQPGNGPPATPGPGGYSNPKIKVLGGS
jgi:hypothetical protein